MSNLTSRIVQLKEKIRFDMQHPSSPWSKHIIAMEYLDLLGYYADQIDTIYKNQESILRKLDDILQKE